MRSHHILFIPELLDIVFNFLDRETNVTNACVCKRWSEIALDVVWREVDDIIRLFRLLKPISLHEETFEYVRSLHLPRLVLTHLLVRSLSHSQKQTTGPDSKSMPRAFGLSNSDRQSTISKYAPCWTMWPEPERPWRSYPTCTAWNGYIPVPPSWNDASCSFIVGSGTSP